MEKLYQQMVRGEIGIKEYNGFMGSWVADHPEEYPLHVYPVFAPSLRAYCVERSQHRREYSPDLAHELGAWVRSIVRANLANDQNLSLFLWSLEKCQEVGLTGQAKKLEERVSHWGAVFPHAELVLAEAVLDRDASARAHSSPRPRPLY